MAVINPHRAMIQQEDTQYKRSVSEVILSKVGAQNNFINTFQNDAKTWTLNGSFMTAGAFDFYDGPRTFFYNAEIVGVQFWQERGVSGTTEFDIKWIDDAGAEQGTIFTTTPKIKSTGKSIGFKSLVTNKEVKSGTITIPTFSKTTFSEGDSVYMVLKDNMAQGYNGGIMIYYRPIN